MPTVAIIIAAVLTSASAVVAGYLYHRYRKVDTEMGYLAFYWRLARGRGVHHIGPRQLDRRLADEDPDRVYVDLRAPDRYAKVSIPGVPSHPFDDFLKAVVVDGAHADDKHKELVLICDTGHLSVIAGDLLVEDEGFERVSSLEGGVEAYQKYRAAQADACCSSTD